MVTLQKTSECSEETYITIQYDIKLNDITIGYISLMTDEKSTYMERIDIAEEYQNKGYGTQAITELKSIYSNIFTAPDNVDAQRLYNRLGNVSYQHNEVDQGYGEYTL